MNVLFHPMVLPITVPLVAGLVCLLLPDRLEKVRARLAVVVSLVTLVLVWPLFSGGAAVLDQGWLHLRVDGLSAFVLLATAFFALLIAVYSTGYMRGKERQREYYGYFLWTIGMSCGAALANDLIFLLVCWGFLGLTLYLMIGLAGADGAGAAKKTFVIIGGSDSVLMLGAGLVWWLTDSTRMDGPALAMSSPAVSMAFICFVAAAFAKAGAMPLHTWLPDCGEKAPAPVAALLPAALDKLLGIYLLARTMLHLFQMNAVASGILMLLGAVTVVGAVMMALVQHDMKRLLSYHAVSQVGYMILGLASGTAVGIAGGLFHMLNNAIYKSALFLCAGAVEKQAGHTDLDRLGGLARTMPWTFATCAVAALAISGVPPLNGFASKWMVYQGIVEAGQTSSGWWVIWLAAAMLGSALTLASFAKVLHAAFLCEPSPETAARKTREVEFSMRVPMVILAVTCILFGIFAYRLPIRHLIAPAVTGLTYSGVWWAGPATVMLLAAILVGVIFYKLTTGGGKLRRVDTYVGGEQLAETRVTGVGPGEPRHITVTGVDFYRTIQDIRPLHTLYDLAHQKVFDIYEVGSGVVFYFVGLLRKAHTGVLSLYLTWFVAGLLAVLYLLLRGGH